ncbi:hypothetical protein QUB68_08675 [Microcoleus sp. A006_D1]
MAALINLKWNGHYKIGNYQYPSLDTCSPTIYQKSIARTVKQSLN